MEVDQQDPRLRQLRIKTGVLKRLDKELVYYHKEIENETKRLEAMKKSECANSQLELQQQVINESVRLIPDCQKRLRDAYQDLKALLDESQDLSETELYLAAREVFDNVKLV